MSTTSTKRTEPQWREDLAAELAERGVGEAETADLRRRVYESMKTIHRGFGEWCEDQKIALHFTRGGITERLLANHPMGLFHRGREDGDAIVLDTSTDHEILPTAVHEFSHVLIDRDPEFRSNMNMMFVTALAQDLPICDSARRSPEEWIAESTVHFFTGELERRDPIAHVTIRALFARAGIAA